MDEKENGYVNEPEQSKDTDFITEKIKQRPINKKKLLRRTILTAAMAVLFALVACLTFLILEPVISNWLYPEEEPAPIELPAETEEMLPEDMIADESEIIQVTEPENSQITEEQISQMLKNVKLDVNDYSAMYTSMADVAKEAGKSVVTVTGSVSNVNWFNDPYESKDQTSGVIVARRAEELYILVNYKAIEDADSIVVTFVDGEQVQAQMKKKDKNTTLAIVTVAEKDLKKETISAIKEANMTGGSGSTALVGSPVIAIGSPIGTGRSVCYGVVTSNNIVLNMADAYYKLLTTDIYGSQNASGILVNMSGQIIGIIDNSYNISDMKNLVSGVGITELKKVIERMSNGLDQAYLGVSGTDVTIDANETLGVPFGAYITEIDMDSPAMAAGIQSGDIITKIGDKEIKAYNDLVYAMIEARPEQNKVITLMRQGQEEYTEMEIEATIGILE